MKYNIYYHVGFEAIEADSEDEAVKIAEQIGMNNADSIDLDEVEEIEEELECPESCQGGIYECDCECHQQGEQEE